MSVSPHKFLPSVEGLKGCYVAGGAITSTFTNRPIVDVDIYPKSWAALEGAIQWAFDSGLWCVFASNRAMTFTSKKEDAPNVQIMTFDEFATSQKIFEAFDFTCCMGAYDLDTGSFEQHENFLLHCAQRFLSFNPLTRFPYASAWRVRKYEEKSFTIGKMEFHKILMACAEKPIRSWDDLKEQVGGVYGEAFDIPDGEEFSVAAAHRAMSTMRPAKPQSPFTSAEDAILLTSPVEREFWQISSADGKPSYWVKFDDDFTPMECPPRIGKRIDPFNGGTVFKKVVKQDDGSFCSNYRKTFIYRIGDVAESPDPFLWVTPTVSAARAYNAWSGKANWAVIEIKAAPEDIIWTGSELKIKRGVVVAEHPADEPMSEAA